MESVILLVIIVAMTVALLALLLLGIKTLTHQRRSETPKP